MTSEAEWDPSVYDDTYLSTHDLLERISKSRNVQENAWYNLYGDIKPQVIKANSAMTDDNSVCSDTWDDAQEEMFFDAKQDYGFISIDDAYNDFYYGDHNYNHDHLFTNILCQRIIDNKKCYNILAKDIRCNMYPLTARTIIPLEIDYESKRQYFLRLPVDVVKKTFQFCTCNMRLQPGESLKKRFKLSSLGANIIHRQEPDATDMIYADTPGHDSGVKNAHIFVGTESKLTDVFGARDSMAQTFLKAFKDWVRF